MQGSARVRPGVVTIVRIVQASSIAGNCSNFPVVSAEMNRLGRGRGQRSGAFNDGHRHDRTTLGRCDVHGRRRVIRWLYQKRRILIPQVSRGTPSRACLNCNERLVRPRLDPPRSAPRIHNNALSGTSADDTPCDGINSLSATLRRWRDLAEFN